MADDEVEEQMVQRSRRTPPKRPCHREPSGEEPGPSDLPKPVLPKRPVTFDKAIQTMRQLCPKRSMTPESAPLGSVPSASQAHPTASDSPSVAGGLAASSALAPVGGSVPRPATLQAASSSAAASHEARELPNFSFGF
ncbi:hypothetical protein MTO96_022813 [Rhipicephalus appendiculatus]